MTTISKQLRHKIGRFVFGAIAMTVLMTSQSANADMLPGDKFGIVLMHGKGGTQKRIASLGSALAAAGVLVKTPLMPWSAERIYDKGYEESMTEIDAYVADLETAGAKRIIVAGHSVGANAALGYSARRGGLSGVILLAYGHVPGKRGFARKLSEGTEKARQMIDAGKGEESAEFIDSGGANATAVGSANDVFSWFAPNGPATLAGNARNVKPNTPVLCIDGNRDRWKRCSEIMGLVPEHSNNEQTRVDANHVETPSASVDAVLKWLRDLR